ncbi:MAG: carbohydrate binding family 9 domain-containing protein [Gemmatimonadetes bacterium]|nr:carbohydrate binding family 9 domain-containing protein [Gemmatimonadota bacterium]
MIPAFILAAQVAVASAAVPVASGPADAPARRASPTVAEASRAERAVVVDGRDDDAAWRDAQIIDSFRQFDPVENGDPRGFRTEAKVVYDDRYLYVFVRAFDPRPDSLLALLSRRDVRTQSDWLHLMIDSYHDRRTGYRFTVNPAGVQRDVYMSNDGNEDLSWDAVWSVATRLEKDAWTAEYRIPFSQLRFAQSDAHTFGLAIWRDVGRTNERLSWPLYRRNQPGMVSQFGELRGLDKIASPRRLEATPYTVAKDLSHPEGAGRFGRQQAASIGADVKYGLTSNLTLDATINPDFGQVEADPSVLNLTAFEQFYQERRPFFLEGQGIFRYDLNCNDGTCSGLFYSRRIGRSPQLGGQYYDASNPLNTTILGAAKVTGRLANGLSIGVMDAMTQREVGTGGRTIEPAANYGVMRLQQDLRKGNSGFGLMLTSTDRQLDRWSEDYLRGSARSLGVDFRHRFSKNRYQVSGYLAGSRVSGSATAIDALQRNGVHNYQRTDANLGYDPSATSMGGATMQLALEKQGGGKTRFFSAYQRTTPGFEVNDVGFLARADQQSVSHWFQVSFQKPTNWYRRVSVNFNQWTLWNTGGQMNELGGNINAHAEFTNQWWGHIGANLNSVGNSFDDRVARGGPAVRQVFNRSGWVGLEGDRRWKVQPMFFMRGQMKDASGSWNSGFDPEVAIRVASRMQARVGLSLQRSVNDAQWYGNQADAAGATHYTFARLDQHVAAVTTRLDITATRTLSLQLYASPFVATGSYSNLRELKDGASSSYAGRYAPYGDGAPLTGFNFKEFRSNTVVRWEYRPGSTLFFVWSQGRQQDGLNPGSFQAGRDMRDLFRARPDNTLLIKAAYWFAL